MYPIIIIGGGPIGLNAALMAADHGINVLLLESSDVLGGQLSELYPEKDIVDIPSIPCVQAQAYVTTLVKEIHAKSSLIEVHMHEKALAISENENHLEVSTTIKNIRLKTSLLLPGSERLSHERWVFRVRKTHRTFFMLFKRWNPYAAKKSSFWAEEIRRLTGQR